MNSQAQPNQIDIEGYNLKRQLKSSASWFYWIAALSMINWISSALQIGYGFILGLGITQFIDGFALALKEDVGSNNATADHDRFICSNPGSLRIVCGFWLLWQQARQLGILGRYCPIYSGCAFIHPGEGLVTPHLPRARSFLFIPGSWHHQEVTGAGRRSAHH